MARPRPAKTQRGRDAGAEPNAALPAFSNFKCRRRRASRIARLRKHPSAHSLLTKVQTKMILKFMNKTFTSKWVHIDRLYII